MSHRVYFTPHLQRHVDCPETEADGQTVSEAWGNVFVKHPSLKRYWVDEHGELLKHNGIFRSADDCATWQEIDTAPDSSFGFAVAVHPEDPCTAWFVPAIKDEQRVPVDGKLKVTRTRDGGRSFEALTQGLPPDTAYDLVYRTRSTSTPRGNALPSAPPRDPHGCRMTKAIPGRRSTTTCRPFTPSASLRHKIARAFFRAPIPRITRQLPISENS
jgi:hypothetical protein